MDLKKIMEAQDVGLLKHLLEMELKNLHERSGIEVLRFVHDQESPSTAATRLEQKLVELLIEIRARVTLRDQTEFDADRAQQFVAR